MGENVTGLMSGTGELAPSTRELAPLGSAIELLPYQREAVSCPARLCWWNWSRQIGKSFAVSLRRILRGLERGRDQIFLSAGERQSRELMGKAALHLKAMKLGTGQINEGYFEKTDFKQLTIEIPGGIRVIGLPANPDTARGYTGDVFLDEFAMHRDHREIYAAVYGSLLRSRGEMDVASTPKSKKNTFYALGSNDAFHHSTVTLPQAVEYGLEVDVAEVRAGMPYEELYRQEFLCEFIDEATALLTHEMIAALEDPQLPKGWDIDALRSIDEGNLFLGMDIGRHRDLTVIWVWHELGATKRAVGIGEFSKMPFREQFEQLRAVLSLGRLRRACIDATGLGMQLAEQAVEVFGKHRVEPVTFTAAVKDELATLLRVQAEDHALRIPVDAEIHNDFHSITKSYTTAGNVRYQGERRLSLDGTETYSHADRFWAAALGLHAGQGPTGKIEVMTMGKLAFAREGIW